MDPRAYNMEQLFINKRINTLKKYLSIIDSIKPNTTSEHHIEELICMTYQEIKSLNNIKSNITYINASND